MPTKLAILLLLIPTAFAVEVKNCTVNIPGYTNHGDCELLCRPSKWTDLVIFYLANYVAHIATLKALPGQSMTWKAVESVYALIYPTSGVVRGLKALSSRAIFARNELEMAARAGALCEVVEWCGKVGCNGAADHDVEEVLPEVVTNQASISEAASEALGMDQNPTQHDTDVDLPEAREGTILVNLPSHTARHTEQEHSETVAELAPISSHTHAEGESSELTIANGSNLPLSHRRGEDASNWQAKHGKWRLPSNYSFQIVERSSKFQSTSAAEVSDLKISRNYSGIKAAVALGQAIYAINTLYHTRGDQISRYGYAAFGLTVAPYAVMSLVNLSAALVCPDYDTMYVIENDTLKDLRKKIGVKGMSSTFPLVGALPVKLKENTALQTKINWRFIVVVCFRAVLTLSLILSPIFIVGGLSGFRKGESTLAQRVWTMMWMMFGIFFGIAEATPEHRLRRYRNHRGRFSDWYSMLGDVGPRFLYGATALGGFVVVGKMIVEYGVCERID